MTGTAQACVYIDTKPLELHIPPPEGMTDPAAIARWEAEREAHAEAYEAVALEGRIRERRRELADFAQATAGMEAGSLAESLALNLTPPLEAAFAEYSSCGDIIGPPVLDPAGYHQTAGLESVAIARGIFDDPEDAKFMPRREIRRIVRPRGGEAYPNCLAEARAAVSAALLRRFSQDELARALAAIRRSGFDRVPVDETSRSLLAARDFRLLAFVEGRSGPLQVSTAAKPNDWGWHREWYWDLAPEQVRELRDLMTNDPLGRALVEEVERVVAQGTAVCPGAMREQEAYWAEVRRMTYARKAEILVSRRQRREAATSSEASPGT
ncbi:hypothetical protein K3172_06650 [Qipengyuania sp. 6B39]|uniref:hypothetical protein n=1 Tax=Qipengyuania proteolytica TaxID=2867239 RepID=UPI001C891F38|nr:hypothetical protein [Qipengyuania proteolytica]MBX7495536.1 hypothetical protein [Qipengyuania proteolytica]